TVRNNPEAPDDPARGLVDLTHRVLLTSWELLARWLHDTTQQREFRSDVERYADRIARHPPARVQDLEAPALVQARRILEWIASTRPAPRFPEQQETYLEKLRQYVQWRSKRQQWVRRVQVALRVVLCVYSVLLLLVYGAAIYQKKLADQRSWEIG